MVNDLGEGPTKITITNASIDKQIALKRDYIYKIENTDLEIGGSARRCSRQPVSVYALRINLLNINGPKNITQRSWCIYNNEVKRIK